MRVVMLGSFPLDPNRIPGGVEAVIHNLCMALARRDEIDLTLVTCCSAITEPVTKQYGGFEIRYLPGQRRFGTVTSHTVDVKRLLHTVNELQPDIVHSHGSGRYVAAGNRSGFPHVVTVHGIRFKEVVLHHGFKNWCRSVTTTRFERKVLRNVKHIFVIADYVARSIAHMSSGRQYPIANPVAEKYFGMATTDGDNTILSVAAMQPRKGIIHLVEALALVRRSVPDANLRLIGKVLVPAYADAVREKISELGLESHVQIDGFVSDQDLQDAFTSCAVFALCSAEESSPVSIAEAMTLGKTVVASAVGGVPDLVSPGETGYLTEFGDVKGIAEALTKVLSNPEQRANMGHAARIRAEKDFAPDAAAEKTIAGYRTILSTEGDRHES